MSNAIDIIIATCGRGDAALCVARDVGRQCAVGDRLFIVWQATQPAHQAGLNAEMLFSSPPNLPRARNAGFAHGNNPIVLFLDDDVEIQAHLLAHHRQEYADDAIGAVGGYVEETIADFAHDSPSFFDETTGELRQNFMHPRACDCISVKGANMSFRRAALDAAGGFDENYAGNALWEEIDCAFRVRACGYKIRYCPTAKVRHVRLAEGGCHRAAKYAYVYRQFANTAYFAARFARPEYYRSWLRFWKYRLEFMARKKSLLLRHDPFMVLTAAAGAVSGIISHVISGRRVIRRLSPISKVAQSQGRHGN